LISVKVFIAFLWQKYLLEKRAVVDFDNGKLLNEDSDIRSVSSTPSMHLFHTFMLQKNLGWKSYFKSSRMWRIEEVTSLFAGSVQVLQFLMDDVSDFLSIHFSSSMEGSKNEERGCTSTLQAFIDYISLRETENFRSRKEENKNSITLTTIHQVLYFLTSISIVFLCH
jgi:hypothetical protein